MKKKVALVILDGWGLGKKDKSDAIFCANTPFTDSLNLHYPNAQLRTDGENVGLPIGQMGNSEVGHMNIGAGRIVWQMLAKINNTIENNQLQENSILRKMVSLHKETQKPIHLLGLLSDGGVHSHINHLLALCDYFVAENCNPVFIHAFLDGRDTDPKSGINHVQNLLHKIKNTPIQLASLVGRYFAMDRDHRWERIAKAYHLMVQGMGTDTDEEELLSFIEKKYAEQITDEFFEPTLINKNGCISEDDIVLCFNFRTDRGREITMALSQEDFPEYQLKKLPLHYFTFTEYDSTFNINGVVFENQNLENTLGEIISDNGLKQLRAAETEKYPHVTYFFSGGREREFENEYRVLANSPKVATYDLMPQMSASELTENTLNLVKNELPEFVCLNYANADMVGHTGVYSAIIKAVETVDSELEKLVRNMLPLGYEFIIIADHGNSDYAINEDGSPNTAHTTNPVPCWYIGEEKNVKLNNGILADIAPTILHLLNLQKPIEMTGNSLISKNEKI